MYVITGTSGTGKSALLTALMARGYKGCVEPVRKTLEYQLAMDGRALPSKDPERFVEELLSQSISDYIGARKSAGVSFFDRGLPDIIGYARRFDVDSTEVETAAKKFRYGNPVFVLPPWKDIFVRDDFRKASYEDYEAFHLNLTKIYSDLNYRLIVVPKMSILSRVDFIESVVNDTTI